MNGREFFEKHDGLVRFLAGVMALLPKGSVSRIYRRHNGRGNLAVLMRYLCLKVSAKRAGKNVGIMDHVYLHHWENLEIGDNVSIHEQCNINAFGGVRIGDNVSISHGVSIVSFNHTWADENTPIKYNPSEPGAIVIGNDVWVGCGARILAGVTIGERSVIAAGAVVTRDCEPHGVYAGVPAKLVKRI